MKPTEEDFTEKQLSYIANIAFMDEYQGHFPPLDPTPCIQYSAEKSEILIFGKPENWKDDYLKLAPILLERGIKTVYIPDASTFNGSISSPFDFCDEGAICGMKIFSGCKTEGLVIPKDSAALITTADCPTVVYHDISDDFLVVAHAGLGSVIDLKKVVTGEKSREMESVVDDLSDFIITDNEYEIFIVCGISYNSYFFDPDSPVWGEKNKRILAYLTNEYGSNTVPIKSKGGISIQAIIKHQFIRYGIDVEKITCDGVDTYTDSRFWSHRRTSQVKEEGSGRNGILVVHKR